RFPHPPPIELYTLSLHDALPISIEVPTVGGRAPKILSKHELTNILEPRAAEIAKLVYRDLEKVGLEKEIRSGVVIVGGGADMDRSEEHTSELQSRGHLVCRRLLE